MISNTDLLKNLDELRGLSEEEQKVALQILNEISK